MNASAHAHTYCDDGGTGELWYVGCGWCGRCGARIARNPRTNRLRSRWFCAPVCTKEWRCNHMWPAAREAALKRDGRCVRCPAWESPPRDILEVNHKVARNGAGYHTGCHNHLDNLETLCHPHHLEVTAEQRKERDMVTRKASAPAAARASGAGSG